MKDSRELAEKIYNDHDIDSWYGGDFEEFYTKYFTAHNKEGGVKQTFREHLNEIDADLKKQLVSKLLMGRVEQSVLTYIGKIDNKEQGDTKCRDCGKPHRLLDSDAGTDREMLRLCLKCFNKEQGEKPTSEYIAAKAKEFMDENKIHNYFHSFEDGVDTHMLYCNFVKHVLSRK